MADRKLLLADDSITIQKVVHLTFADEGIDVISVGDGDSAMERIQQEMPDVVLADVNMPGLNGYQVCEHLRNDERTSHIPVILLVGAFEQFDEAEAARVGAATHITKPFQSIRQLVNQVTDFIEASRAERPVASESNITTVYEAAPQQAQAPVNPFDEPVRSQLETFREDRIASIDHEREPLSEPPEETARIEPVAEHSNREADEIDNLYLQSITAPPLPEEEEFPDVGVDDEMIETSYSAPRQEDVGPGLSGAPETTDQAAPEAEPFKEVETHSALPHETLPLSPYETTNLSAADLPTAPDPVPPGHDETVRLDPAMVEAKMAESNRRFEPIEQPPPPVKQADTPVGEDTIRMASRFDTKGSAAYEFDDVDLLDLPSEKTVEVTSPADALAKGENKQIVTLSPELIEMIAQRVVEKMSEKH